MLLKSLGPYELKDAIGHGGMGTVFLGIHRDSGKRVAIKVLAPAYAADPGFRERFEAEIQSLEKLKHPHIVELFGYGEENGTLYYAMELVEGASLQKELSDGCRFSWREVIDIGISICGALKQAHDHGIIHRDIKPANLLFTVDSKVKLSDFGIAKLFGNTQITADGGVLGTADYMAPEQAEGTGATIRSDLYSVGSVLFCLLAGRPPFQGKSMAEVVHKVRYDEPIPIRRLAADTPEALEVVIQKLLSKDPNNRVPTARALSNRLKAIRHALSLKVEEDVDPGLLTMGPDETTAAPIRDANLSEEEFADLETVVEGVPHPEDVNPEHVERPIAVAGASANGLVANEGGSNEAPSPLHTRTHFTPVDEEHRRRRLLPDDNPPETTWGKIASAAGILALLGLLFFISWKLRQPRTADQLYTRIHRSIADGPHDVGRSETNVLEFLSRFPDDPRFAEIDSVREDIDLERLGRQLSTRDRNKNRPLAPVEQALVDAIRKEPLNPVSAQRELMAIIDVFSTDKDATKVERKCIQLAKRRLTAINSRLEKSSSTYVSVIQTRLDYAIPLLNTDRSEGESIISGIIELYDDKPWASDIVAHAREVLAESKSDAEIKNDGENDES